MQSIISHASCVRSSSMLVCMTELNQSLTRSVDGSFSRILSRYSRNLPSEFRITCDACSGVSCSCSRQSSSCWSFSRMRSRSRSPAQRDGGTRLQQREIAGLGPAHACQVARQELCLFSEGGR